MKLEDILQQYYGYETFREGQKELIEHVLNHQSALGILPTGAGNPSVIVCRVLRGVD